MKRYKEAICSHCKEVFKLHFQPTEGKPVFCPDCSKKREEWELMKTARKKNKELDKMLELKPLSEKSERELLIEIFKLLKDIRWGILFLLFLYLVFLGFKA